MLTDLQCKNAKPREKEYSLADGKGLYLCITSANNKIWRTRYNFLGKWKWYSLGAYPEMPIVKAREDNLKIRQLAKDNIDPVLHRKETKRRLLEEHETTFTKVAQLWYENKKSRLVEKHAHNTWRRIEVHLLPDLGSLPITNIKAYDLIRALKRVEAQGKNDLVRRLKQNCREIFTFAIIHGMASHNPATDFQAQDVFAKYGKHHFASISADDIPEFMASFRENKARMYRPTAIAIELMMLLFVRTSELIQAPWSEFYLDKAEWNIPAGRMKMHRPHHVPLCRQAVSLLRELQQYSGHRELLFPNRNDPRRPMSNNTILQDLKRMGYKGRMTGHGFRSLAMTTIKEKLGVPHEVIDLQLAHVKRDKIQAAYDRTTFIKERTAMMQAWGDYLEKQAQSNITILKHGT